MIIVMSNHIKCGFGHDDIEKVNGLINELDFTKVGQITFDFTGVKPCIVTFCTQTFGNLCMKLTPKTYEEKIKITGMTEISFKNYLYAIHYAKEYYEKSKVVHGT